jgi:hypothetical protein
MIYKIAAKICAICRFKEVMRKTYCYFFLFLLMPFAVEALSGCVFHASPSRKKTSPGQHLPERGFSIKV